MTHLGQRGAGPRALGGHGEHGGDAQRHAGGCGVHVDPEGHPGQDDDEQRGDVHLDQVVAHLPLQVELHLDAGEHTWVQVTQGWLGSQRSCTVVLDGQVRIPVL